MAQVITAEMAKVAPGFPGATFAMELIDSRRGPAPAPLVVPVTLAVCCAVLNVAAVATPLPSTVSVTGLVRPKFWQFRLPNEPLSRAARKLARLLPSAGTGEAVPVSIAASSFSLGVWTLTMFWQ